MKFLIQRVNHASVTVDKKITGEIGLGFLVLIGVSESDTEEIADKMIKKLIGLRIFEDSEGKTNLALKDVGGSLLLVSQFTLYADCKKGRRPSFTGAAAPAEANRLYEYFMQQVRTKEVGQVGHGVFGADMKVELLNDGPVTIMLDTDEIMPKNK